MAEYKAENADNLLALVKNLGGNTVKCKKPIQFASVEDKARCMICVYKRKIPNNMHIQCAYDWLKGLEVGQVNILPLGSATGIGRGLYMFPVLYDPIWMIVKCQAFNTIIDEKLTLDGRPDAIVPLMATFQLITNYALKSKSGGKEDVRGNDRGQEEKSTEVI